VKTRAAKRVRREIFVLTPEEKRTVCFVLIALLIGLGTKHYRSGQPLPSVKTAVKETAASSSRGEAKRPKQAK
jgi:hypothetical protein